MAATDDHRGAGAASRRPRRRGRLQACRVAAAWGPAVSRPCPRVRLMRGAHGAGRVTKTSLAWLEVHGFDSSTSATIRTGLRASVAKHYRTSTCLVGPVSCCYGLTLGYLSRDSDRSQEEEFLEDEGFGV
uniref:Uncharacterized protein n=1 Tax=Oryza sativa subsp. japonica TaxID=39947 RepID=Q6K5N7_ORYSJ|nr:hypothetical protein [Oryza sativa Japonica Group]